MSHSYFRSVAYFQSFLYPQNIGKTLLFLTLTSILILWPSLQSLTHPHDPIFTHPSNTSMGYYLASLSLFFLWLSTQHDSWAKRLEGK